MLVFATYAIVVNEEGFEICGTRKNPSWIFQIPLLALFGIVAVFVSSDGVVVTECCWLQIHLSTYFSTRCIFDRCLFYTINLILVNPNLSSGFHFAHSVFRQLHFFNFKYVTVLVGFLSLSLLNGHCRVVVPFRIDEG